MVSSSDVLNGKVLVVDDQEVNVLLLERMLRGAGYLSVTSTMNSSEVRELHLKNRYDLILLDLQMPGMDGFQVMESLKEIETDGYLPVLVITAQPGHKLRALSAGAKDFVSKPLDLPEVLMRVYNMLEIRLLHLKAKRRVDAEKRGRDFAEAIVESLHEPLLILRKNLDVVTANKAFYRVFHVSSEETQGRQIYDLGDGQWNIPRLRELLHQVLPEQSTIRDFEVEHDFERVGRKVVLLNACEVFDPNANEQTILLTMEDITDRKRAEEALQNTNTELQHFAYALAHDLREPLRMVVNFTELLAQEYRGKLGLEADRYIGYSVEGARRMDALMKDLLAYWETTALDHSETATDCNVALEKALRNLEAAIMESGAAITFDPLPTVLAEEAMLIQLFQNLIANSIKYRGEEPARIHVSAENAGTTWLFSVRDNGIGIDPQHFERIFGILKRLHGRDIPGTGIGLALCKKIVERGGGKIWVESEVGRGATFKFTIPVQAALLAPAETE
jgi:PAS domain S-box-containing protein